MVVSNLIIRRSRGCYMQEAPGEPEPGYGSANRCWVPAGTLLIFHLAARQFLGALYNDQIVWAALPTLDDANKYEHLSPLETLAMVAPD